ITNSGAKYLADAVVLTAGTSSRGKIIIGDLDYSSGPNNTLPSIKLSENLLELGVELARFKTGTPPRIHADSVTFEDTVEQPGDTMPNHFSFLTPDEDFKEESVSCWLTHTNAQTHEIIQANLHRSPMFSGMVEGVGARYCPSIEDKIVRFSDKPRHQIFIEPEGANTKEMYVQGLSTSLPEEVQVEMLRTVKGMENAKLMRPGYAIEYDVVIPHQLDLSLEVKSLPGLFTAGQMNGTSGYEEAAGQGIMAGINAARKVQGKDPLILKRNEAYIGVMIDDLVTKGTTEPYRLLTSRAEYRLLLRHDNADTRLTEKGYEFGLVTEEQYNLYKSNQAEVAEELDRLANVRLKPTQELQDFLAEKNSAALKDGIMASDLLRRPELKIDDILKFAPSDKELSRQVREQVEIQIKYAGYIVNEQRKVEKLHRLEQKEIPADIDWDAIDSLATEARQRLKEIGPRTLAQASRVSGVNPADVSIIMVYLQGGHVARV